MILYIAEKPSLGRAIAEVLPKPLSKQDGFIRAGNGDCVSWCIGHLLEQAEPDAYDPAFKQWRFEHLPIVPEQWQLTPKAQTRKQLGVLRQLVKTADQLVHAGDPDREGQLLVDQVIAYLKVSAAKRASTQRCLISDLNPTAVARALTQLRSNQEFVALSTSALARSRADWLYGINMTRAYTLQGRKVGYAGVLSVGRVQTPVLGLVVRRDQAIESFVSKPYYEVLAHLVTDQGGMFTAQWQPSEACQPYMDEEGRVLNMALAENVVRRITQQPALVTSLQQKPRKQAPPLAYNLSSLQIDAARRFGLSAQQVLDLCQQLYERHKLITYPRSDSRHLPTDHWARRHAVVGAIQNNSEALAAVCTDANLAVRSKVWDDAKVEAHHAIIPTERKASVQGLSQGERQIYELIARQYLCQFYPAYEYLETQVEVRIGSGLFTASARQTRSWGWKVLFGKSDEQTSAPRKGAGDDARSEADASVANVELPPLRQGDRLLCERGELLEKQTRPPQPFNDATLLAAMTGISRFVLDPEVRKVLKDTDGLGTEATRAGIIELLFKRGFLRREGKAIRATPAGTGLIESLPESAVTPDMTAQWEVALNGISQRQFSYDGFMKPLEQSLAQLIAHSQASIPTGLTGVQATKPAFRRKAGGQKSTRRTGKRTARKPGGG